MRPGTGTRIVYQMSVSLWACLGRERERDIQIDIESDRHTVRQTYNQTDIQSDRHTVRQTYSQTDRQSDKHTVRQTYSQTGIKSCRHTVRETYSQTYSPAERERMCATGVCVYMCFSVYDEC